MSAHATTVELRAQVPPLVDEIPERTARLAAVVVDSWLRIDKNHRTYDAAIWAVVRILADDEIAAGLRDTRLLAELGPRLEALDDLHQPRRWRDSDVVVCDHCQRSWPCESAALLNGELVTA